MTQTKNRHRDGIRSRAGGRARATTHGRLSRIGLALFLERGFDETTVDDIVRAAGIGRRTFFRYFPSKNDLPWGDFDSLLRSMREYLAELDEDVHLGEALRRAAVEFNRFPLDELAHHRDRMWLLFNVPSLMAHSTLRYASWRVVIAEFVATRRHVAPKDAFPQAIAQACLGLCVSAYEQWLADDSSDLLELIDRAFRAAETVFGGQEGV
ncbi:mycofactocin system transcriptional regulator [Brevibacterium sp. VCM10]|uniref:mycofactocin system transcriptional regulator n=1 Tax=Brevibacterium sp. VCM10 TaxID=1381751 RepID=UPI00046E5C7C|nr:mycofactocin system transcriptional regulator [Brevibacterium sp. VCM10]